MYDSASCSYAGALELKGASGTGAGAAAAAAAAAGVKQENWPYRGLTCGSTFQRLKESVDKAKQALADRGGYLAGAFSPPPRANPSAISPTASITGKNLFFFLYFYRYIVLRSVRRCCKREREKESLINTDFP